MGIFVSVIISCHDCVIIDFQEKRFDMDYHIILHYLYHNSSNTCIYGTKDIKLTLITHTNTQIPVVMRLSQYLKILQATC